jgi:hypothetical protein
MAGHLIVQTRHGNLQLNFLESIKDGLLCADLTVDGERSTGAYHNATGELTFALDRPRPFYGEGPYSGTIRLENPLPE